MEFDLPTLVGTISAGITLLIPALFFFLLVSAIRSWLKGEQNDAQTLLFPVSRLDHAGRPWFDSHDDAAILMEDRQEVVEVASPPTSDE